MAIALETLHEKLVWLECRVDQGMFSDEFAVTYPSTGPWQKSVFVEKQAVELQGPNGIARVRVRLFQQDGQLYAVLPSPNGDIVHVRDGDVSVE
jgi:hypothetical protein